MLWQRNAVHDIVCMFSVVSAKFSQSSLFHAVQFITDSLFDQKENRDVEDFSMLRCLFCFTQSFPSPEFSVVQMYLFFFF